MAPSTAASMSASSNTMKGALPPNSKETFLRVDAACFMRILPTLVEPVKVTLLTNGFSQISLPTSWTCSLVVNTLTTPLGIPASSARYANANAEYGVSAAGLMTVVQPVATAAPTFLEIIEAGKFQGVMIPQTPTGCLIVWIRVLGF
ncbi:hypothetical protein AWJ20_2005 [Sugiyamaella lignohabitans]|uniref:Uncharacterized protein n=1 Tax=Sugiyamaella lignohabitans TaxID=796027 RepID=A0A161HLT3_9ASCO|nr:uncharacterized protein AWJ20_2005 [Sugiyamaella lignohabitans]ANB14417.1 hypothetical protein AWJ20_2005 [Sugiyamaella lignohabitans]